MPRAGSQPFMPAGEAMEIVVTLPWPPPALLPNAKRRSHWRKAVVPTREYRATAFYLTRSALGRRRFKWMPKVHIDFHPPDARRRDDDGMIGAFKAGRDGVAEACGTDDYRWFPTYAFHPPHRPDGKVVVTLTGKEDRDEA